MCANAPSDCTEMAQHAKSHPGRHSAAELSTKRTPMSSPPSYPRYDFGENLKNLAKAVAAVEFALFPFLIITFVLLDPIVRIATAMKLDLSATSEGLLAKQYLFFANHELISPRVASALLIFKVCMSICVIVVPLR